MLVSSSLTISEVPNVSMIYDANLLKWSRFTVIVGLLSSATDVLISMMTRLSMMFGSVVSKSLTKNSCFGEEKILHRYETNKTSKAN